MRSICMNILATELLILILNREVGPRGCLVLVSDEVGDLLVFGLLDGTLVILGALAKDMLLGPVDAYSEQPLAVNEDGGRLMTSR